MASNPYGSNNKPQPTQGYVSTLPNNYPPVYQGQIHNPPTVVIMNPPVILNQGRIAFYYCPICKKQTKTQIITKTGGLIWIMCLVFFFFTFCLFFIPFLIDQWKDKQYNCAECGNIKGIQPGRLF